MQLLLCLAAILHMHHHSLLTSIVSDKWGIHWCHNVYNMNVYMKICVYLCYQFGQETQQMM